MSGVVVSSFIWMSAAITIFLFMKKRKKHVVLDALSSFMGGYSTFFRQVWFWKLIDKCWYQYYSIHWVTFLTVVYFREQTSSQIQTHSSANWTRTFRSLKKIDSKICYAVFLLMACRNWVKTLNNSRINRYMAFFKIYISLVSFMMSESPIFGSRLTQSRCKSTTNGNQSRCLCSHKIVPEASDVGNFINSGFSLYFVLSHTWAFVLNLISSNALTPSFLEMGKTIC